MLAVFSAIPAFATTYTVTSLADSGAGSLRDTIAGASFGDTINITASGTIMLGSTLTIGTSLTISGPGASSLAISGNNAVQVLNISGGITVNISGVTIENGNTGSYPGGGGILNYGTLTISGVTIENSSSPSNQQGGGIYNGGTLTVTKSTISGNSAGYCAGIANGPGRMLTISNSTISENGASSAGGGICNSNNATLTVTNSTMSGNSTQSGGGIFNGGTLTVSNSTISGNSATSAGGGIYNDTTLTLTNSTLAGNSATYFGGGIYNAGALTLSNSTLAGNFTTFEPGGGIYNSGTLNAKNSIVANSPSGGNCSLSGGTSTSLGHNLSDDTSCSGWFNQIGDLNNPPGGAGLDPSGLQYNGGPTETIALLATSPAVDAIPVSPTNYCTLTDGITPVATDQRGIARPQGPACDIGAFELVQNPVQAVQTLISAVQALGLPKGTQQELSAALQAALGSLSRGDITPAIQQLQAFINKVNALLQSGRLASGQAAALIAAAQQIIQTLGG